ncbi:hypothetical protein VCHA53O466_50173 [Vibrio chagasii]|nr:hypothetical protein VCHA53O466_50173 [Vibrio chagasii]
MYLGEKAKCANLEARDRAKALIESGSSKDFAFKETGWFQGLEGAWKFVVDVRDMTFNDSLRSALALGQPIDGTSIMEALEKHPALDSYHQNWNVQLIIDRDVEKLDGSAGIKADGTQYVKLEVPDSYDEGKLLDILIHEYQHVIQEYEGFAIGGQPSIFKDRDMSVSYRAEKRNELNSITLNHPEFNEKIQQVTKQFYLLENEYSGDDGTLDWDLVPDDVADKYFDDRSLLLDEFPEEEDAYDDLKDSLQSSTEPKVLTKEKQYSALAGEIEARLAASNRTKGIKVILDDGIQESTWDVHDIKPIVSTNYSDLRKAVRAQATYDSQRSINDISLYADNFSRILLSDTAEVKEIVEAVSNTFLAMYADLSTKLPEDNQVVKDFNKITAWIGVEPHQWKGMSYIEKGALETKFSDGFLAHIAKPVKRSGLNAVYSTLRSWTKGAMDTLKSAGVKIESSPEMEPIFESLVGGSKLDISEQSDFQMKMAEQVRTISKQPVDVEMAVSHFIEAGYKAISEKSGIAMEELTSTYNIEFAKMAQSKRPVL